MDGSPNAPQPAGAVIIPFPVRQAQPEQPVPNDRLAVALTQLSAALTEQRTALLRWRAALEELRTRLEAQEKAAG